MVKKKKVMSFERLTPLRPSLGAGYHQSEIRTVFMLIIKSDSVDMSTVLKDQTDQVKKLHHRHTKIERQRTLTHSMLPRSF